MKKHVTLLAALLLLSRAAAQETLSNLNCSWTTVIPGKVLCEPALTSYGICAFTDARTLIAISDDGKTVWERPVKKDSAPITGALPGDFITVVTGSGKKLSLLNPDGRQIWAKTLNFSITERPYAGRDGRFFVRGKTNMACFGLNGITKWSIRTPAQKTEIPVQELPDGSLILFLQELSEGKSRALRVSPFGTVLEEITFAGEVKAAASSAGGVLITFTDGNSGLFSVKNGAATNEWVFQDVSPFGPNSQSFFAVSADRQTSVLLYHENARLRVIYVSAKGASTATFLVPEFSSVTAAVPTGRGIFLMGSGSACFYTEEGVKLWEGILPARNAKFKWNYFSYTGDDHLLLFGTNWTVNAYRVTQASSRKKSAQKTSYSAFINSDAPVYITESDAWLDRSFTSEARYQAAARGNYGEDEILWYSQLLSASQKYVRTLNSSNSGGRVERSVFQNDTAGTERFLSQLPLFGTDLCPSCTASVLRRAKDRSIIGILLHGIAQFGYDPDGRVLAALAEVTGSVRRTDDALLCSLCDAASSVCGFMGRQATSGAKEIISALLSPQYSETVRNYARETLVKLSEGS